MRILRYTDPDFDQSVLALQRKSEVPEKVEKTVREIIADIRARGDKALLEYTERFDGFRCKASELRVEGKGSVDAATKRAITASHANVRDFAKRSLRKNWKAKNRQGAIVGERFDPFQRVGIYVPGGAAPLVSSAVMTVTLAKAAGVPEIVVATSVGKDGVVNPALLYALQYCGATEIYRISGAQSIAALAYGTPTIKPVQKIFGPGAMYTVEAKRQVFGKVAVDLLPGPSEILVIADSTGNPAWIAADLLAQAEHGHNGSVGFITNSARLLKQVEQEVNKQLATLSRGEFLEETLDEATYLVLVKDMKAAVDLANDFAPEHLAIVAKDQEKLAANVRTSGAIFLGGYSPVAAGDFAAGPSHELPTGGAGKSFPGLTVDQFQRRTSIVSISSSSLRKTLPIVQQFATVEGLDAHRRSAEIRFE